MAEPLSLLAGVVTTCIVPKALEKIGEKGGEIAFNKIGESIQALRKVVQEKLRVTHTDGVLALAEANPTETNLQMLEAVLTSQMQNDQVFTTLLQKLIDQMQAQSPSTQVILDTVRIKGNTKLGNIEQVSDGCSAEQVVGRNLGVGGDFVMGDITQKSRKRE
jgi:hypothetical protein